MTATTATFPNDSFLINHQSDDSDYQIMDEYELYEQGFVLHNKYKFIKLLQIGSFGKVTLAIDQLTNVKYAIKSMFKKQTAMFRHEINIMNKLGSHPNLVQLIEHFDTTNYHILVLEYCDDGDLYDKIEQLSDKPIISARLIKQLINVIKYLHSKRIYHRDIKPENILLMQNGDLKLCDYGLSTVLQYPLDFNIGTEKYMSPESINEINYDAKLADYWSLGITICFLLFGKCPFKKLSLDDDNYINFINNNNWLMSYYDTMSFKTFQAVINLLSLSPLDRDLLKFESLFEDALHSGLTIQQELQMSSNTLLLDSSDVFAMDDENLQTGFFIDEDEEPFYLDITNDQDIKIPTTITTNSVANSIPVPSLIDSHMSAFSWADDDDEFELRFFNHHLNGVNEFQNQNQPQQQQQQQQQVQYINNDIPFIK